MCSYCLQNLKPRPAVSYRGTEQRLCQNRGSQYSPTNTGAYGRIAVSEDRFGLLCGVSGVEERKALELLVKAGFSAWPWCVTCDSMCHAKYEVAWETLIMTVGKIGAGSESVLILVGFCGLDCSWRMCLTRCGERDNREPIYM